MIKTLSSFQYDSPVVSGEYDKIIGLFDACLVSGFNNQELDSLSSVGTVATGTVSAGHNLSDGDTVRINGAVPTDYNGDYKIFDCSTTEFSYTLSSSTTSPAAGTITCKIAPLDWVPGLTGTHKKVFQQGGGNGRYLRVNEVVVETIDYYYGGGPRHGRFNFYESMEDVEVGSPVPSLYDVYVVKSVTENNTQREWFLVGNEKQFYLFINATAQVPSFFYSSYFFGDFNSFVNEDLFNTVVLGYYAAEGANPEYLQHTGHETQDRSAMRSLYDIGKRVESDDNIGGRVLRNYRGELGTVAATICSGMMGLSSATFGYDLPYNIIDGAVHFFPVYLLEYMALRGILPGLYCTVQMIEVDAATGTKKTENLVVNGSPRTILTLRTNSSTEKINIDLTGPWE